MRRTAGHGPGHPRAAGAASGRSYFPPRDQWEVRKPAGRRHGPTALSEAIAFAKTQDSPWGKTDYHADQIRTFGRPLGPVPASRGGMNGVIVHHGYIVAEFGDTCVPIPLTAWEELHVDIRARHSSRLNHEHQ